MLGPPAAPRLFSTHGVISPASVPITISFAMLQASEATPVAAARLMWSAFTVEMARLTCP